MTTENKILFSAIFLGTAIGTVIGNVFIRCKQEYSKFDGDEMNSYADGAQVIDNSEPGMGGTSDTTVTAEHNMPMHKRYQQKGRGKRFHGPNEHAKFWNAYNKLGSMAHDQLMYQWYAQNNPNDTNPTDEKVRQYFAQNAPHRDNMAKISWGNRHGIKNSNTAHKFWAGSTQTGSPEHMEHLYNSFYPNNGLGSNPAKV